MMDSKDKKIVVAVLDFGSSAIKLAVAEKELSGDSKIPRDRFKVIYLDTEPSEGAVQRGVVFNLSETSEKVRNLLVRAEEEIGVKITNVHANISGQGLHSLLAKMSEEYSSPHEITDEDIRNIWSALDEEPGKLYLYSDPAFARFVVNGSVVQRPVGVKAMKLEMSIQAVVTESFVGDNVEEVVSGKLGLGLPPFLVGAIELSKRALTPEQKRIGSAMIDFGAETTTVCYFNHGVLESLRVLPMGGNQLTYDLTSLDISPEEAERIKLTSGSLTLDTSDKEELTVKAPDMRTDKRVSRYKVNQFIEARTREIIDNVKAIIARAKGADDDYRLPGGIVITGGASRLAGLVEYVKEQFGGELSVKQVGTGFFPDANNEELINNPEFHSVYALLYQADEDATLAVEVERPAHVTQPETPIVVTPVETENNEKAPTVIETATLFDEEEMEEMIEDETPVKEVLPTPKKTKKKAARKGSFWGSIGKGITDLFAMQGDESQLSDDED